MAHPPPTMGLRVALRRTGPGGDPLERALRVLKAGGVVVTSDEVEHAMLERLCKQGIARPLSTSGSRKLWNPGRRLQASQTVMPPELKLGMATFVNKAGLPEVRLKKYAKRLTTLFESLRGWRSDALKGGLTVVLASPQDFHGTAGGEYRQDEDALYVRAAPAMLKRAASYGSFDYIIVHELGHRYRRCNYPSIDYNCPEWWTTRRSQTDRMSGSESFAELFALGHFRLTGSWDQSKVDRFEKVMSGSKE